MPVIVHCSCVSMLADLYHAEDACGTATVGSSEVSLQTNSRARGCQK